MNKTELQVIRDIKSRLTRNEKQQCQILLDSLSYKFSSKYSYYFYYFINSSMDMQYNSCHRVVNSGSCWVFTIQDIHNILICRNKYTENFHLLKIHVLDKLVKDFNISISVHSREKRKVETVKIHYHGIKAEKIDIVN
jgi:hypothetical protein